MITFSLPRNRRFNLTYDLTVDLFSLRGKMICAGGESGETALMW